MTVTYSLEVSKARLCGFAKLLVRWRGSIYRLMYREMLIFTMLYYVFAIVYRYFLAKNQQMVFEQISTYCREFTSLVPITFCVGFYVTMVVTRWWQQYLAIPWPDRCVNQISTYIQGMDERGRLIRRALARYLNIMSIMTLQMVSTVIKKRFPTMDHMVEAGLLTVEEKMALDEIPTVHGCWWVPGAWYCQLAMVARKEGRIHDDLHLKSLIDDCMNFRSSCGMMLSYDWISIPLVYTQVVAMSVYCFFIACLFGRQYLYNVPDGYVKSHAVDYYVPFFTFFQFFFYMGWLKVAEEMICPYGEDDDDFELNWVLDHNVQVSYLTVDFLYRKYPKLARDQFWDMAEPEIPYTTASASYKTAPFMGSTISMKYKQFTTILVRCTNDSPIRLFMLGIAARDMEWQLDPIVEEKSMADADDISHIDVESIGTSRRLHRGRSTSNVQSPEHNRRPRFLNVLLAGDSRPSLVELGIGSRFGFKSSVASKKSKDCRSGPHSGSPRSKSPIFPRHHHRGTSIGSIHLNGSVWAEHTEDFVPRHIIGLADQRDHINTGHFNYIASPDTVEQNNGTGTLVWKTSVGTLAEKVDVPPVLKEEPEPEEPKGNDNTEATPLLRHEQVSLSSLKEKPETIPEAHESSDESQDSLA